MIKYTDYERANNVEIEYVLEICHMRADKYGRYICPFHADSNPSAYIRKNRLFCFGCENETGHKGWSNIDIVMQVLNITKENAVKTILGLGEGDTSSFEKVPSIIMEQNRRKESKEENPEFEEVRESFLKKARAVKDSDKILLKDYLEQRKINTRVLEILDKNSILYGTDEYNQPAFVFNYKHCVFRHKTENKNHSLGITKGAGSYIEIKANNLPIYYITEGIYDALTLLDRDNPPNVICLNSVNYLKYLIEDIESDLNYKKKFFILALDNDNVGQKSTQKIINVLNKYNIKYNLCTELTEHKNCKDVNELRVKGLI